MNELVRLQQGVSTVDDAREEVLARLAKADPRLYEAKRLLAAVQLGIDSSDLDRQIAGRQEGWTVARDANVACVFEVLQSHPQLVGVFSFNEMAAKIFCQRSLPNVGDRPAKEDGYPRELKDADVLELQVFLQRSCGLKRVSHETCWRSVELCAEKRRYHPVRDWLETLEWDRVGRLDLLMGSYFGVEPGSYASMVGTFFLIGMVSRIYRPGGQLDYMPILEGGQGARKSSACRILAGGEYFSDHLPDIGSKDCSAHLDGLWLVELSELEGAKRAAVNALKAFITRREERYRPAYARVEVVRKRTCALIGSSNERVYLRDTTGNRRFWPVRVGRIELELLARDRSQLFAEAVCRFKADERFWPTPEEERRLFTPQQAKRLEADDMWMEMAAEFFSRDSRSETTLHDFMTLALRLSGSELSRTSTQRRAAVVLEASGWKRSTKQSRGLHPYVRPGTREDVGEGH